MSGLCRGIYNELRLEETLCDAVIRVSGVDFKVHRLILCGCSSYFRDLFCSKPASQQQVYSFPGVSPNVMQLILDYAYTGSVTMTEDNVMELLRAAELFGIQTCVQSCCSLLLQKLCSRNCISIWKLADQYKYTKLRDKAFLYMLHHFEDISGHCAEFLLLSGEQLADIIGRDELYVKQESVVFQAVLRWVNFAPEERRDHMTILMSKVRLLLMPVDYLLDTVTKVDQVMNNLECVNMVINTIKVLRESNTNRSLLRTRLPSHALLAFGGIENNRPTDKTELYDVRSGYWRTVFRSDKALPEFSSCVYLSGSIYYIGGCDNNSYLSSVQKFCLATQTWQKVGSMHKGRCFFSVVVLNGLIYAMGGMNYHETLNSAERFDPETNQWSMIAPMYEPRADAGCATLHGKVYICGGRLSDGFLSSIECYNPNTNRWMFITLMTIPRAAVGVIGYKDHLYVIGGYNGVSHVSSVDVYDPLSRSWETASPMIHPRCNFGIAVLEDQLFVVGGFHKNGTSSVERYNGTTDSWQLVQDLEAPRFAVGCCVVERRADTACFLL